MTNTNALAEKPRRRTRARAIRAKCLDCCCDSALEVRNCELKRCPLWPYRLGYEVDYNGERKKGRVHIKEEDPSEARDYPS